MPSIPWEYGRGPTEAEQRLDDMLGQGRPWARLPDPVEPMDVHANMFDPEREIRGEYLARRLVESDDGGMRAIWKRGSQHPVIRIEDALITGRVNLRAADMPYLLEFVRCRFDHTPDFRQTNLAGLVLAYCRFPGLNARNLSVTNDTMLVNCTMIGGRLDLADAQLGGSLVLNDSELRTPGRRAMFADRLSVGGALLALRLTVAGELRIPGIKVGGNLNFSGSTLRNRGRIAINANGVQIAGSLRGDVDPRGSNNPFSVAGVLYLPSATIQGDLRLRDAVLEPGIAPSRRGQSQHDDPVATLIADRGSIRGDIQLDQGFYSGGTIRIVSAKIGGDLRMSGATIDLSWSRAPRAAVNKPRRALHLDGTEIEGNLDAAGLTAHGQLRFADAHIRGSFQLNQATVVGPRTDVLQAHRIQIGNNLDCREADISGSLRFQGARIAANLDLRATKLIKPSWHHHRETYKPSLDLRAAQIGRDLICAEGDREFSADGEVQLRRAVIERQANFIGCRVGEFPDHNAISAFGLLAQELTLLPNGPPCGRVDLQQASCELFTDNAELWSARGGIDVEDFGYDTLRQPIDPTDQQPVRERLRWLRTNADGEYQPGPYDQLAKVFRGSGNEEHVVTVLVEKQRRRYQAIARASRPALRLPVRLWSLLQSWTVSYGYRPIRALFWLLLFGVLGTLWFGQHELVPVNEEDHPVWNPFLYTVDQLVPIVDLGHDAMWRAEGGSQWITVLLIAAGWVLATTVAAGITRTLHREA